MSIVSFFPKILKNSIPNNISIPFEIEIKPLFISPLILMKPIQVIVSSIEPSASSKLAVPLRIRPRGIAADKGKERKPEKPVSKSASNSLANFSDTPKTFTLK